MRHRFRIVENSGARRRLENRILKAFLYSDWQGLVWATKRLIELERA